MIAALQERADLVHAAAASAGMKLSAEAEDRLQEAVTPIRFQLHRDVLLRARRILQWMLGGDAHVPGCIDASRAPAAANGTAVRFPYQRVLSTHLRTGDRVKQSGPSDERLKKVAARLREVDQPRDSTRVFVATNAQSADQRALISVTSPALFCLSVPSDALVSDDGSGRPLPVVVSDVLDKACAC